jgi:hypothetical protein
MIMGKTIDTSILEKYREEYEAGKITLIDIEKKTKISDMTICKYTVENKWDKKLARKNQILLKQQPLISKIEQYKNDFESGVITKSQLREILKCDNVFLLNYIKENNWDCTKNIQANNAKSKQNLFKNFIPMTKENQAKGVIAAQKARQKRKLLKEKYKNFIVGDLFYTIEGIPLYYTGIKNNKPSAKNTLYSKYTYTNEQITHLETQKM